MNDEEKVFAAIDNINWIMDYIKFIDGLVMEVRSDLNLPPS